MIRRYYEILEVSEDATPEEIERAYKRKASKHHPDKNPGRETQAAEEFKDVKEAYECLSDPERRQFYDETGQGKKEEGNSVEDLFVHVVNEIMDKVDTVDELLQAGRHILSEMLKEATNQKVKLTKELKVSQKMLKHYQFKGKGENYLGMLIEDRIKDLTRKIDELGMAEKAAEQAHDLFSDYQALDKMKPRAPQGPPRGFEELLNALERGPGRRGGLFGI